MGPYRVAISFAVAMIAFARVGVWLNMQLPVKLLLVFLVQFTASAAVFMLSFDDVLYALSPPPGAVWAMWKETRSPKWTLRAC